MKMNFILPHSFELDLPGIPLLSTLELLLFGHSNIVVRAKAFIMGITSCGSIWIAREFILDRLFCFRVIDAQDRLVVVFLYGGNIPFVVSLCFASQRIPTVCPNCAGSISTIGLAPFCFKSAGLALSWASAVLLWFLALLYIFLIDLSIRRVHKDKNIKLCSSWKMADGTYKMPLSVRPVRTIVPFGEELCSQQGGLPGKSQQSCPEVPGRLWRILRKTGESVHRVLCVRWICANKYV